MAVILPIIQENRGTPMTKNKVFEIVRRQITLLFREAEKENLSPDQFAVKIWLGTILGHISEITLVSILFEKATNVSPEETYQMISDLAGRSKLREVDAVKRAISLIIQGLQILDSESKSTNQSGK
ncbi:hypothetical protein [Microcoleus sp. B3-D7]|uniref:hypothetical protein n=1 Tax=Microcoleus sp. B3-D7 TaxID=2818659 RepID=UPI002FD52DDA